MEPGRRGLNALSMARDTGTNGAGNPLVEEVRRIRGIICEQTGHDVDRLCDQLIAVGRDFDERRGVFAGVTKAAAARVIEAWGDDAHRQDDPIVDELREIRRRLADGP